MNNVTCSSLNITCITIGLKLHGPLVKPRPLKSQKVILGNEKVQVGNDQEMAQSERNSHSIYRGVERKLK